MPGQEVHDEGRSIKTDDFFGHGGRALCVEVYRKPQPHGNLSHG